MVPSFFYGFPIVKNKTTFLYFYIPNCDISTKGREVHGMGGLMGVDLYWKTLLYSCMSVSTIEKRRDLHHTRKTHLNVTDWLSD